MISIPFILTAILVIIAPGPAVLYTLSVGLNQGQRAVAATSIGLVLGIAPHILAATLGLAAFLHTSALAFATLKYLGAAYLLYLAYSALKRSGPLQVTADRIERGFGRALLRAALVNLLNPKVSLFFLALLPPFLSGNPDTATIEMLAHGGTFMSICLINYLCYGFFASAARDRFLASQAAMRWINRGVAAIFAGLGLNLALARS